MPILSRLGGVLFASADMLLPGNLFLHAMLSGGLGLLGPVHEFGAQLMVDEETDMVHWTHAPLSS